MLIQVVQHCQGVSDMSKRSSPIGESVSDHIKDSLKDPEFRAEYERLAPYEELARIVIMRRAALGLTQAELAARMGTTASAVSRIESGQHATNAQTLKKLGRRIRRPRGNRLRVRHRREARARTCHSLNHHYPVKGRTLIKGVPTFG